MLQRVMIAMALSCEPDVLIADEPTTALDVTIQAQILQLIKDIQAETGMGLIMITHDLGVIAETVDRVVVMYGGKVMETGPVNDIFKNPLHPYTRALLNSIPGQVAGKRRLTEIAGASPNPVRPPAGCPFHPRCPSAIAACHQVTPALEAKAPGRTTACIRIEAEAVAA
jgi:oligopeptide/dipeptide ABC transporter ATP-binding protein